MRVFLAALAIIACLATDTAHRLSKMRSVAKFDPEGCQAKLKEVCGNSRSPEEMGQCATTNEQSLVAAGCLSRQTVSMCRTKAETMCPVPQQANVDPKAILECLNQHRSQLEEAGCPIPPTAPEGQQEQAQGQPAQA
ncbi:hypothetical protein AAMO2058_000704400 [Amorphochlora amoebiformis]|eukprot:1382673-Amorphochlora_amoeboformis.AAC.2